MHNGRIEFIASSSTNSNITAASRNFTLGGNHLHTEILIADVLIALADELRMYPIYARVSVHAILMSSYCLSIASYVGQLHTVLLMSRGQELVAFWYGVSRRISFQSTIVFYLSL